MARHKQMHKAMHGGSRINKGHRREDGKKGWPHGLSPSRLHNSGENHQVCRQLPEQRRQETGLKLMVGKPCTRRSSWLEVDSPGEKGRMQGLEQKPGGKQNKGQKGSNLINRLTNTNTNTGSHRNGPQSIGSHSWPRIHSIQRERFK